MAIAPVETVVSPLLSELASRVALSLIRKAPPKPEPLPADVDFADSLTYGYVEGLNEWAWRVLGEEA